MNLTIMLVNIYESLASTVIAHKGFLAFWAKCKMLIASCNSIVSVAV